MCLDFREFVILGLVTRTRICEVSISMIASAHNNNYREILKYANLFPSRNLRKLKPREYYQVFRIYVYRHGIDISIYYGDVKHLYDSYDMGIMLVAHIKKTIIDN